MTRERATLVAILAGGLGLRLAFLRVHQTIERDGVFYASVAEHVARGGRLVDLSGQPHTFYPPGYPVLVAPVYLLLGDSHRAGQAVSLVAGLALVWLASVVGRRLAGERAGLVAAALAALYPPFVHSSVSVMTEATFGALLCLLILAEIGLAERPGVGGSALAGALVGALYLIRPEGLLLAAGPAWLVGGWLARREPPARVGRRAAAFGLALAALVLPYVLYLHAVTGAWLLSGKGVALRAAETRAVFESIAFGPPRARPWQGVRAEALALAERYLRNLFVQEGVMAQALSLLAVGLAAVGLAAGTRWRGRLAVEGVAVCGLAPLLLYPAFEVVERWTEPYMVIVFLYAARGVLCVAARAAPATRAPLAAWGLVGLLALRWGPQLAIPLRYTPAFELVEQRDAGRWIRGRGEARASVMSRVPEIAYYARARWVALPYADISGVVAAARGAGVTFLVLDELSMRRLRPELLPLLDEPPPPGLTLVHQSDEFPARRVRVFLVGHP